MSSIITESPDFVKLYEPQNRGHVGFSSPDARSFLIFKKFIIVGIHRRILHGHIIQFLRRQTDSSEYIYNTHDSDLDILVEVIEQSAEFYGSDNISRSEIIDELPTCIMGRIWLEHKIVSFWNTTPAIRTVLPQLTEMFEMLNQTPDEYMFELDNSELVEWKAMAQSTQPSPNKNSDKDWQKIIHLAPADKKGDMMKAQGIQPKKPIDIKLKQQLNQEGFGKFFHDLYK